jgi:hypothetical protein
LNRSAAAGRWGPWTSGRRWIDLNRYQLLRELITDERALAAINALIREIGDRLAELEDGRNKAAASSP